MEDCNYNRWKVNHFSNNKKTSDNSINVERESNDGKYICFVNVRFTQLERGMLQAFVLGRGRLRTWLGNL